MKKLGIFLTVFILATPAAFAQLKNAALGAKNLANLERALNRAVTPSVGRPVVTRLPPNLVPGNAVGLLRVKMPKVVTPVNLSYVQYVNQQVGADNLRLIPHKWIDPKGEHVLYDSQNQLARDLNAFYGGEADVYASPDHRKVKLYALPVDGLLYKPAEYKVPLVLNSNEYFVVYDIETQTGKIALNTPQVYTLYKRLVPTALHQYLEDLYRRAKKDKEINGWLTQDVTKPKVLQMLTAYPQEPVCRALSRYAYIDGKLDGKYMQVPNDDSAYQLEKRVNARDRATGYWKELWDKVLPYSFTTEKDLGRALANHFQEGFAALVEEKLTGKFYGVYELPVKGIKLLSDRSFVELDGDKQVVLYRNPNEIRLVDRQILEDPRNFVFYNQYYQY